MDMDDAQEGPRNSMAQREMEHAKSGNNRMSHRHLKDEARVAHAGGRNCTEQPGTHGATELATTLRPPEVSVWSGDIDLHICATNVDVKLLLFYFFPSDIK